MRISSVSRSALCLAAAAAVVAGCGSSKKSSSAHTPTASAPVATTQPVRARSAGLGTIEQFIGIRTPGSARLSPDGTAYFRDWPDGVFQVYARRSGLDPSAPMTKLTSFKDGVSGYTVSPDGSTLILSVAPGGNEQFGLHMLDAKSGAITALLDNPNVVHRFGAWLKDGSGFLYEANDTSPTDFHIYRYNLRTRTSDKLYAGTGDWSVADVSTDGSRALIAKGVSVSDVQPYELNCSTGETRDLALTDGAAADNPAGYLPGDREAIFISDKEEGRARMFVRNLETGEVRKPLPDLDSYEIDGVSFNENHSLMSVSLNRDGFGDMRLYRTPAFEPLRTPRIDEGVVGVADMTGDTILFAQSNAREPGVTYAFKVGDTTARAITKPDTRGVDLSRLVLPRLVKYRSFDGVMIPAFVFLPEGYRPGTPIPFVVEYHGGPEGQHRPGFSAQRQFLISQGFGVMLPNVRGSTGYGKSFHEMDNYTKRWDSVRDGVEAARWLVESGYSRPGMIAAYGGSYGGFMAAATVVEDGVSAKPVFGASVNIVGIVNFQTFLEQTKGYRRALREVEYGPLTDPEFLKSVSPIHRVDDIKVPMLIAHGLNDPRVPIGEALQLDIALKKRGQQPELLIFPDEGHGFAKLDNRLVFANEVVAFLNRTIARAN